MYTYIFHSHLSFELKRKYLRISCKTPGHNNSKRSQKLLTKKALFTFANITLNKHFFCIHRFSKFIIANRYKSGLWIWAHSSKNDR